MRLSLRFLSATLLFAFLSSFLTPSSACTVGVFGPSATTDGRPILWKNRDVDNDNQEVAFRQGPRFAYVTNVYGSEDTIGAWAGINAAGFAIMNSNSYNLSGLTDAADDGDIMALALGTCATVDELKAILDSTNVVGRTQPANFGCFDSTGRTVFFEASNTFYTIYEASADPYGYLLRANYSMSGDSVRRRGENRYDRAMQVTLPEWQRSGISVPFLVSVLCRDMGQVGFDPYPLPYRESLAGLPLGFISGDSTICRRKTRSAELVIGPRPGEPASHGMMWILLGTPDVALPIPLWVQGGAPPEALNGTDGSEVCDEAIAVREFVRHDPYNENAVNTFRLARVLDILAPTESLIFRAVADSEAAWPQGPSPEQAANLTAWCTNVVLDAYLGLWDELNHQGWGITIPHEPKYKPGPNITRDTIHVSVPASGVSGVVRICDITGRTLTSMPYGPGPSVVTWIPRDLPSGSYFAVYPAATGLAPTRLTIIR